MQKTRTEGYVSMNVNQLKSKYSHVSGSSRSSSSSGSSSGSSRSSSSGSSSGSGSYSSSSSRSSSSSSSSAGEKKGKGGLLGSGFEIIASEGSKSSTHYLSDKNRFDVLSKGPSSGISVPDEGPLLEMSNLFLSLR